MSIDYTHIIRSLVRKTGYDIQTLSIIIDASEKSIYKWMNGKSKPSFEHSYALLNLVYEFDKENKEKTL